MSTVAVSGGPAGSGAFPGGVGSFSLATSPDPKGYSVNASGVKNLNSPSVYVPLPGLGANSDVANADFLYLKSNGPVFVRITQTAGVQVIHLQGMLMLEFPANDLLTLVELEGSATVEYFVSGQS
jgi:hypothetical protein